MSMNNLRALLVVRLVVGTMVFGLVGIATARAETIFECRASCAKRVDACKADRLKTESDCKTLHDECRRSCKDLPLT